jgi:DNA primase
MAHIPKDTVDHILQQADIVEVVSDFVTLKKKGQNLWACCPFHHEKSPSFSVSPGKGIYKCFGCGKAGDAVQFVKDIEGVGYVEALRYLARKYGIEVAEEVTEEGVKEQSVKDSLYILSDFAKKYFHDLLLHHEQGKTIGLPYLKERGLSMQTIQKFELGYSLDTWDAFTSKALQQGFNLSFLEATGLTIVKEEEQKKYDRFRGRVIFPIHNVSGRTIGFGARILKTTDKSPKYLNSPESEIYHKGQVLYGIHQARQAMRLHDLCYLVEGYLDVLSLHQGGIENVVASSGTSLTEGQIKLIGRYTKNITVLYDGDAAGVKASLRGIDLILENGLNVDVVTFPAGDDPDSYIRKVGDTAFKEYLQQQTQDFISFKAHLFASESKDNPVKKAEAIREVVASIVKIPDSIKRTVFLQQCSLIFHIDEQVLLSEFNKMRLSEHHAQPAAPPEQLSLEEEVAAAAAEAAEEETPVSAQTLLQDREREVIRWMITYPERELEEGVTASQYILAQLEDIEFTSPLYARIYQLCKEKLERGEAPSAGEFIRHEDKGIRGAITDLISEKYELSKGWEKHHILVPHESDLLQYGVEREVLRLKWRNVRALIRESIDSLQHITDPEETGELLKVIRTLKDFEKQVADLLGIVVVGK